MVSFDTSTSRPATRRSDGSCDTTAMASAVRCTSVSRYDAPIATACAKASNVFSGASSARPRCASTRGLGGSKYVEAHAGQGRSVGVAPVAGGAAGASVASRAAA